MLNKKSVDDINVAGKKVLVRCDFNVPLKDGQITDENRLVAALPTIKKLISDGGKVILCSHLGKPKGEPKPELSLAPVAVRLSELLGQEVKFAADDNVVGDNAKAALMTRGITEIGRLGVAMGAHVTTFTGLSGIGDLIVTCTSMHSRNRKAGILMGQGKTLEETLAEVDMVVEGIVATEVAYKVGKKLNIELPITNAIYSVLYEGANTEETVKALMTRHKKNEMEEVVNNGFVHN